MAKVDIISGFLGAGKTTLIKKLLCEAYAGEKVILIENEFGEIGIDGGFMRETGITVTEINSGCICCTLASNFKSTLAQVSEQYHPDRILIEPTGLGKLSDIQRVVRETARTNPALQPGRSVAVVDVMRGARYLHMFGEFYRDQIECADAILLSRTQTAGAGQVDEVVALLRGHNGTAPIITAPWDSLNGGQILESMEGEAPFADTLLAEARAAHGHAHAGCHHGHENCPGDHDHHHHAEEVFTSWSLETGRAFTQREVQDWFGAFDAGGCGTVLRAKGMVAAHGGGWLHFDYLPAGGEIRQGPADYTGRICVIGTDIQKEKLDALFA